MDGKRRFLEKVVACGLDEGTITTDDVLAHADTRVLADHLPVALKTKLLEASLGSKSMDSELVVETLGPHDLAEHMPTEVLWACVAECAGRALGSPEVEAAGETAAGTSKSKSNGAQPKPNAKAKPKDDKDKRKDKGKGKPDSKRPSIPPISPRAGAASGGKGKKKPPAAPGARDPRPAPVIPKDEFDIDTDVGEDDWGVDDIVEVVEEAEVVGAEPLDETRLNEAASDWQKDEETVTRGE